LKNIQPGTPPDQADQVAPVSDANENVGAIHSDGERTQASDNIVHFGTKVSQSGRPWFRFSMPTPSPSSMVSNPVPSRACSTSTTHVAVRPPPSLP
jgi:hypothetical protein